MTVEKLTDEKLCQLANDAIEQMEYSHGNHWPLDVHTEHGKMTTKEIFQELISRVESRPLNRPL